MPLIAFMPFLVAIVAIAGGIYLEVQKTKAKAAAALEGATREIEDELAAAQAERDRLRRRIEALEAIVTSEGYDLEREARRAGLGQIDTGLLDLPESGEGTRTARRVRE